MGDPVAIAPLPELGQRELEQWQPTWLQLDVVQDAIDQTGFEVDGRPPRRLLDGAAELVARHRTEVHDSRLDAITQAALDRDGVTIEVGAQGEEEGERGPIERVEDCRHESRADRRRSQGEYLLELVGRNQETTGAVRSGDHAVDDILEPHPTLAQPRSEFPGELQPIDLIRFRFEQRNERGGQAMEGTVAGSEYHGVPRALRRPLASEQQIGRAHV